MPRLPSLTTDRLSEGITWNFFVEILSILTVPAPDASCYIRRDLWFWDTAVGTLKEEYIEFHPIAPWYQPPAPRTRQPKMVAVDIKTGTNYRSRSAS